MQLSAYRLLLYPLQPTEAAILPTLQTCGLLGAPLAVGVFATGETFLDHLCFLGCSPHLELEPCTDRAFCYVQLPADNTETTFQPIRKPALNLKQWLVIGNVHEAEAVPDAALLSLLETATACRWKFAYLKP
ncbi:hypothetical protein [Thiothrix unzii]|jgi:hypothetical protein|uniref:hypothetical protein n=1 Tax=Thiothrix unzii TaxID=111769 RepID=UPI002A35CE76|nr:hypothetical protein [Thiothrix unzii]MDX9987005.1 hypothetical protein [Thiothrix unzii]